jgi:hypothetical protein
VQEPEEVTSQFMIKPFFHVIYWLEADQSLETSFIPLHQLESKVILNLQCYAKKDHE